MCARASSDISGNGLTDKAHWEYIPSTVQSLLLGDNLLTEIPKGLRNLQYLTYLYDSSIEDIYPQRSDVIDILRLSCDRSFEANQLTSVNISHVPSVTYL